MSWMAREGIWPYFLGVPAFFFGWLYLNSERRKLRYIPTVGHSSPILSYIPALKFIFYAKRDGIAKQNNIALEDPLRDGEHNAPQSGVKEDLEQEVEEVLCSCCYSTLSSSTIVYCSFAHAQCVECIQRTLKLIAYEGGLSKRTVDLSTSSLRCMSTEEECTDASPLPLLQEILSYHWDPEEMKDLIKKVEYVITSHIIMSSGMEVIKCPFCIFMVEGNMVNDLNMIKERNWIFQCENLECLKKSCLLCGKEWVGKHDSCKEKKALEDKEVFISRRIDEKIIRNCPRCHTRFVKGVGNGCNRVTCSCGATVCYVCRADISHLTSAYSHFCMHGTSQVDPLGREIAVTKNCPCKYQCDVWAQDTLDFEALKARNEAIIEWNEKENEKRIKATQKENIHSQRLVAVQLVQVVANRGEAPRSSRVMHSDSDGKLILDFGLYLSHHTNKHFWIAQHASPPSPRPHPPPPILLFRRPKNSSQHPKYNIYILGPGSRSSSVLSDVEWVVKEGKAWAVVDSGLGGKDILFRAPLPNSPLPSLDPLTKLGIVSLTRRCVGGDFYDYTARYGAVRDEDWVTLTPVC